MQWGLKIPDDFARRRANIEISQVCWYFILQTDQLFKRAIPILTLITETQSLQPVTKVTILLLNNQSVLAVNSYRKKNGGQDSSVCLFLQREMKTPWQADNLVCKHQLLKQTGCTEHVYMEVTHHGVSKQVELIYRYELGRDLFEGGNRQHACTLQTEMICYYFDNCICHQNF